MDIYLPYESSAQCRPRTFRITSFSAAPAPAGAPGTYGFNDVPVITANATVNFYDNTGDTGGSLPAVRTIWSSASPPSRERGDGQHRHRYGQCRRLHQHDRDHDQRFRQRQLEIGATDAAFLNAQSTSHLIMDLPASTDWFALNQSLARRASMSTVRPPVRTCAGLVGRHGSRQLGRERPRRLRARVAPNQVVGNDTLTGGADSRTDYVANAPYRNGNGGDNFFPEGGVDTVNIGLNLDSHGNNIAGTTVQTDSTVWVGAYDVGNSGAANFGAFGSAGGADWGVAACRRPALRASWSGDHRHSWRQGGLCRRLRRRQHRERQQLPSSSLAGDWRHHQPLCRGLGVWGFEHRVRLRFVDNLGVNILRTWRRSRRDIEHVTAPGFPLFGPADVTTDSLGNYANAQYLQQALPSSNTGDLAFGVHADQRQHRA